MEKIDSCPVHAPAAPTMLDSWACPDDCAHFHAELERRMDEVFVKGNFYRLTKRRIGGRMAVQFYRGGIAVALPRPMGPPRRTPLLSRMRELYRARRR